ncbi:MAG: SRPBCC family protein [Nitrospirota bacterium]|nr:SRPBCC family protein [Nitrospirota bacterium]
MRFRRQITIEARPEKVFAVITDLPTFARLTHRIEEITLTNDGQSHWRARIGGIPIEWDAVITDQYPPSRFTWKSVSGARNSGSWRLTPAKNGTRVEFGITFHPPKGTELLLGKLLFRRFINELNEEILQNLRTMLTEG